MRLAAQTYDYEGRCRPRRRAPVAAASLLSTAHNRRGALPISRPGGA